MYRIIGTDRGKGHTMCYGKFDSLTKCVKHMGRLITAFGHKISFKCEEMV